MKKAVWLLSALPLAATAAALCFMPEKVPMHYNALGEIDRWGSKYENLLFPVFILAFALFWQLIISHFEKKAASCEDSFDEKGKAEALTNIKVLNITAICTTLLFAAVQGVILFGAFSQTNLLSQVGSVDIAKLTCIFLGAFLILLGNIIPKTRRNSIIGLRTAWSLYNDETWRRSNRFGAIVLMVLGVAIMLTAVFASGMTLMLMLMSALLAAMALVIVYSYIVYKQEKRKEQN